MYEVPNHLDVVSGHDELVGCVFGTFWPVETTSNVHRAHVQLWAVVGHEGSVSAAFVFRKDLSAMLAEFTDTSSSSHRAEP